MAEQYHWRQVATFSDKLCDFKYIAYDPLKAFMLIKKAELTATVHRFSMAAVVMHGNEVANLCQCFRICTVASRVFSHTVQNMNMFARRRSFCPGQTA